MKVSIIKNHLQQKDLLTAEIETVFELIRTGGKQRELLLKIREMVKAGALKEEIRKEKNKLPAILFNGVFSTRNIEGLIQASGLMVLDFDDANAEFSILDAYTYARFQSPSGVGVKIIIRIPVVKSDAEFKTFFYTIQKAVPDLDPSGKDVSRLCYFSLDENIQVVDFDTVKIWTEKIESLAPTQQESKKRTLHTNWKFVNTAMQMISNSMVGQRHATVLKAGMLLGGYIAGGEVDESEAKTIIQTHIQQHSPDDYVDHIRAFNDAIEKGKDKPLTKKEIKEITEEVERLGTIHLTVDDVRDEMEYNFENGLKKGYKLGWADLDKIFTVVLGNTLYLYSSAYSGKSQLWNESLVNLSRFYDMRHALLSPETGSAAEVYQELAQIYLRKNWKKGVMTDDEKEKAFEFLKNHFIVLDGDFFDKELSIHDVCDYVSLLERKYNQKIHTLTIDPYNELKHEYGSRQDLALEEELKYVRRSAKNNERHICIITHVRDQEGQYDREGGFTYYHMPTFRDVSGGQTWSRKGMMMMAQWRPIVVKKGNDVSEVVVAGKTFKVNQSVLQLQKAKPKGYGETGEVNLYYLAGQHSFVDELGNFARNPETPFEQVQTRLVPEHGGDDDDEFPF